MIIDGSHIDPEVYLSLEMNETTGEKEYRIKTDITQFPPGEENQALVSMQKKMRETD